MQGHFGFSPKASAWSWSNFRSCLFILRTMGLNLEQDLVLPFEKKKSQSSLGAAVFFLSLSLKLRPIKKKKVKWKWELFWLGVVNIWYVVYWSLGWPFWEQAMRGTFRMRWSQLCAASSPREPLHPKAHLLLFTASLLVGMRMKFKFLFFFFFSCFKLLNFGISVFLPGNTRLNRSSIFRWQSQYLLFKKLLSSFAVQCSDTAEVGRRQKWMALLFFEG